MSTEHALTPSSYITHHLTFNTRSVGGGFWTLNVDTLVVSALLGMITFG
ncbi:MAG: F0F1 ATP synthase subunit A, partial [Gallionella sp.]